MPAMVGINAVLVAAVVALVIRLHWRHPRDDVRSGNWSRSWGEMQGVGGGTSTGVRIDGGLY